MLPTYYHPTQSQFTLLFPPHLAVPIPSALYHPARIQVNISLISLLNLQEGDIVGKWGDISGKRADIVETMMISRGLI